MNIIIALYKIQDYGGIINYTETLAQGFRDLGHNVKAILLTNSGISKSHDSSNPDEFDEGWEYGYGLDLFFHQRKGWRGMRTINYKNNQFLWDEETYSADMILWNIPIPTCSKPLKGDHYWSNLYVNWCDKQFAIIHDGNFLKLYPHLLQISCNLDGIICVHETAFNSVQELPVKRSLIPNPISVNERILLRSPEDRNDGFISLQTFKALKRVDDLVRAIPYVPKDIQKYIAGGGIEQYYMTSKDKIKAQYLDGNGNRIWDNALNNGMEYLGFINTEFRDQCLSSLKLLIDPSWTKSYNKLGPHFNRVTLEAMNFGCVPLLTDLNTSGGFLTKNENYIEIPYNCSPQEYAWIIEDAIENVPLLNKIQKANYKLIEDWKLDKKKIAERYIKFAEGKCVGMKYSAGNEGKISEKLKVDAAKKMRHFYE